MNIWRTLAAWLSGILAIAFLILAWLVFVVVGAFMFSDCSGGWMWTCRTDFNNMAGYVVWTVLGTAAAAAAVFKSVQGLGRWASTSEATRIPTATAAVVTTVFVVAALAFFIDLVTNGIYGP